MRHLLTENRHGPVVDVELTQATGHGEREAALRMLERRGGGRATLGPTAVTTRATLWRGYAHAA